MQSPDAAPCLLRASSESSAGCCRSRRRGFITSPEHAAPATAAVFVAALATELATPVLSLRRSPDRVFHLGHIAERYGLFTIIVLGETILAVSVGLRDSLDGEGDLGSAPVVVSAALVIAFGLWWVYFDALGRDALTRHRAAAFRWGYGHYFLFAALAVPVAISLAAIAWLQQTANGKVGDATWLCLAAGITLLTTLLSWSLPVPAIDALLALIVVALVVRDLLSRERPSNTTGPR